MIEKIWKTTNIVLDILSFICFVPLLLFCEALKGLMMLMIYPLLLTSHVLTKGLHLIYQSLPQKNQDYLKENGNMIADLVVTACALPPMVFLLFWVMSGRDMSMKLAIPFLGSAIIVLSMSEITGQKY